jgi:hypothetical protein
MTIHEPIFFRNKESTLKSLHGSKSVIQDDLQRRKKFFTKTSMSFSERKLWNEESKVRHEIF